MPKYRIGIVGHTGRGNYGHGVDTVWSHLPQCEVVGVADPDERGRAAAAERTKAPRAFADYRQLLDETKPDIVAIGMRWLDRHREVAVEAASRGMHIYLEKPMCRTPEEADAIVAACERHDVKLALAHQTRYSPRLQAVRDLIMEGKLGQILELRGRGKEDQRGGGEDLWVLGSHVFNLMHHFGGAPEWCFASVLQGGHPLVKEDVREGNEGIGPLAGDNVAAMYGFPDGVRGYFGSRRGAAGGRFGLQIYGSLGVLEILTGHLPSVQYLPDPAWSPGRSSKSWMPVTSAGLGQPEPLRDGGLEGGNILAVIDLLDAIESDRQPECNMYEGRTTVEMITAVFASQRAGGPVRLPLEDRHNPLASL